MADICGRQRTVNSGDSELPNFNLVGHPRNGETMLMPKHLKQEHIESALQYEAQDSDIFVCTYPKSGTTWMQNIVWLIVHKGESLSGKVEHSVPMLTFNGADMIRKIGNGEYPRIIKCHLPRGWTPHNSKTKYVYVARNPKDTMVSYYYYCKGFSKYYECPDLNFDRLFDAYVRGEVSFGSYFDHVTGWYAKRNEPNVLFLLYEDLKRDTKREVLKVARFLGEDYVKSLLADDEQLLDVVIWKSSFQCMKIEQEKWSLFPRSEPFVRKGIVGDWKNHLSDEQASIMNQAIQIAGEAAGWANLWSNQTLFQGRTKAIMNLTQQNNRCRSLQTDLNH